MRWKAVSLFLSFSSNSIIVNDTTNYDVLTHGLPYRTGMDAKDALQESYLGRSFQFDPGLGEKFLENMANEINR